MSVVTITPTADGPYLVRGSVAVELGGKRFAAGKTIALCSCGHSSAKPYCDGTHERLVRAGGK